MMTFTAVPHILEPDRPTIEVRNPAGSLVATIYGGDDGIKVVSNHIVSIVDDQRPPHAVLVLFSKGAIRNEPSGDLE